MNLSVTVNFIEVNIYDIVHKTEFYKLQWNHSCSNFSFIVIVQMLHTSLYLSYPDSQA